MAGSTPEQAIKQLHRYQEKERGAPQLFHYTQILMATNRVQAFFGTNDTPLQHYLEWKDPYPQTIPDIEKLLGKTPTAQDISIVGALSPQNILDIIQNFIVYEVVEAKIVKKIPRYQQYRAVNKTITRIVDHWQETEEERLAKEQTKSRGGVIWHTQGSGKSLTMLFLAVKLRRIKLLENPTVAIITDRIDLDEQINGTFKRCNFPSPIQGKSTSHIKTLIGQIDQVPGQTILTTIHKFQESNRAAVYPELALSTNIVVLADEGHRSQYKTLALNMRTAMPNATFIAFTGTPLIKKENITTTKFSTYIDKYTIDQAVEDRATVPILYESRLAKLHVEKVTMDALMELELEDYSDEEAEKIRKRYARLKTILGAEERIKQVAVDFYSHFRKHIHVNGFKAQVVAINRITAARYKQALDSIIRESHGIKCAVIYSPSANDDGLLLKHQTTKEEQSKLISDFKEPDNPLSIIIVVDMLLTGFDAPLEQVMYLDNVLRDHSLLQAIARVNRVYENKSYGLIVDYVGISKYLQKALAVFDENDIAQVLIPFSEAIKNLEVAHQAVMELFSSIADINDIDACADAVSKDVEILNIFLSRAKEFERALDVVLPDPMANDYKSDYIFSVKLQEYLKNTGRSGLSVDYSAIAQKIRELIDEYVRSSGVELIVQPVSILSPEFDKHLDMIGQSSRARALAMSHATKQEISVQRVINPEFYDRLSKRLEKIIEEYNQQRLSDAEFIENIQPIILEMQKIRKTASNMGMNETQFAFYTMLNSKLGNESEDLNTELKSLVEEILDELGKNRVVDWKFKEDIQRQMRKEIKLKLINQVKDRDQLEALTIELVELAKNHL